MILKMKNDTNITSKELEYIMEVNAKAISIYTEVAQQNESIINTLDKLENKINSIEKVAEATHQSIKEQIEEKVEKIEKNLFRLLIILSSTGVGMLYTVIQSLMHH